MAKTKGYLSVHQVLWIMVFCGFAVNYMIRVNINIAIVEMVRKPIPPASLGIYVAPSRPAACLVGQAASIPIANSTLSANFTLSTNSTPVPSPASLQNYTISTERPVSNASSGAVAGMNEYEQGLVLGAFFWLFWLTQLPGGVLASRYGTKIVFGWGNAFPGVIGMFIPFAANYGVWPVVMLRMFQGILAGFTWPAMHHLTAQWVPPDQRSKFVSAYLGSSLGAALTFPACGSLMAWAGWPAVFYASGAISVIWAVAWYLLVFDSPAQHPRISPAERAAIEDALRNQLHNQPGSTRLRTPWMAIITSIPVWMNICAQFGAIWGLFTLLTQAPTYFRRIHGWGIHMTGILSGVPHLSRMFCALAVSYVGDSWIQSNKMSRTNVRKAATALCNVVMGIFILMLAWSGCNATAAAVFLILATTANGAVSTGVLASLVDISPNFASIVMGVCSLVTVFPGFISPYIVGLLTLNNQTTESWKMVFIIAGLMPVVSGFMFVLFADSEVQPWNLPNNEKGQELKLIKNGTAISETKYHPVSKRDAGFDEACK